MPVEAKVEAAPIAVMVHQPQVHPVYSSAGVPVNVVQPVQQPDHTLIRKYQLNVKWWSRFCVCVGYFCAIGAAIQVVTNTLFVVFLDAVPMSFAVEGTMVNLSRGYLFLLGVAKIVVSVFWCVQGKTTIGLFSPILSEYARAERGETNGIRMERKSNLMKAHKSQIKKITVASLGMTLFALIITNALACDVADQVIEAQYTIKPVSAKSHHEIEMIPKPQIMPEEPIVEIVPAAHPFNKPEADSDFDDMEKMLKKIDQEVADE